MMLTVLERRARRKSKPKPIYCEISPYYIDVSHWPDPWQNGNERFWRFCEDIQVSTFRAALDCERCGGYAMTNMPIELMEESRRQEKE